jgi:hypothetical protein
MATIDDTTPPIPPIDTGSAEPMPRLSRRSLLRRGSLAALATGAFGLAAVPGIATGQSGNPATPTPTTTGPTISRAEHLPTVVYAGQRPVINLPTPAPTPLPPTCYSWRGPLAGWVPNPLTLAGATITLFDHNGNVLTNAQIRSLGGSFIGLEIGYAAEIVLVPSSKVTFTLVHYNPAGASVAVYEGASLVGQDQTTSAQDTEQPFGFLGKAIDRVIVKAPQYETLLLDLCFSPV